MLLMGAGRQRIADYTPLAEVDAGGPYSTTNGTPVALAGASASGVDSVRWQTSGDGTFSPNNTTLAATYTPGSADRTAGAGQNVILTLVGVVGGLDVTNDTAALGVTITGTDTRRVENDAKSFDGGSWADADGAIYPDSGGRNARVRFSTHESGTAPPAGATYTAVNIRWTGGLGDAQTYHFVVRAFASAGDLAGSQTLELMRADQSLLDDVTEKTFALGVPTTWSTGAPQNSGLQFEWLSGPGGSVIACSNDLVAIDMYADMAWSKAPP